MQKIDELRNDVEQKRQTGRSRYIKDEKGAKRLAPEKSTGVGLRWEMEADEWERSSRVRASISGEMWS